MDRSAHAETILVVDNDPITRDLITRMLDHRGYAVLQALSGEEALGVAASHAGSLPLLVTDILMPGMDGFRLADLLTVSRPEIRILFICDHYDDSALVRQGLGQTPRSFLLKPFGQDQLASAIREALDRPPDRDRDPFALILANPNAAVQPMQDRPLPDGLSRALRFRARLTMRLPHTRELRLARRRDRQSQSIGRALSEHLLPRAEDAHRYVPDPAYGHG